MNAPEDADAAADHEAIDRVLARWVAAAMVVFWFSVVMIVKGCSS